MDKRIIFIAIYRALDCLADETGNTELASFLDKANIIIDIQEGDQLCINFGKI